MGQPGCNDVTPSRGSCQYTETYWHCNYCGKECANKTKNGIHSHINIFGLPCENYKKLELLKVEK